MTGRIPSRRTLIAGLTGIVAGVLPSRVLARTNTYYQGAVSDHYDGTRFFNPGRPDEDPGLLDVLAAWFPCRALAG